MNLRFYEEQFPEKPMSKIVQLNSMDKLEHEMCKVCSLYKYFVLLSIFVSQVAIFEWREVLDFL